MFSKLFNPNKRKQINRALIVCLILLVVYINHTDFASGQCQAWFPFKNGWLGGDGLIQIQLDEKKQMWLFGETYIQTHRSEKTRAGSHLIANSMAIAQCKSIGGWAIKYFWDKRNPDKPNSIFDGLLPGPHTDHYTTVRPNSGFIYQDNLYISFDNIAARNKGSVFGFKSLSHSIARITNHRQPVALWNIEYAPLPIKKKLLTSVVDQQWLYLLFAIDKQQRVGLARIALNDLFETQPKLSYLHQDGQWQAALNEETATVLTTVDADLQVIRTDNQWLMVYGQPEQLSPDVKMQSSRTLAGPWSRPKTIYSYPEMGPDKPSDTFCFNPRLLRNKDNPQLAYLCSSLSQQRILEPELYQPKVVKLPKSP